MSQYARIENNAVAEIRDFAVAPDPNPAKGFDWRLYTVTKPALNADQIYVDNNPAPVIGASEVTVTYVVHNLTAQEIADRLAAFRDQIVAQFDLTEDIIRGLALAILDELNAHTTKITAILNAIDGASNLATLKTAVAAIADPPQRSAAQIRTAIRAKLGT